MILNPDPNYPSTRRYVLKLHRDARPARDQIRGRLENMFSGQHVEFSSAEQLVVWLVLDLGLADVSQTSKAS